MITVGENNRMSSGPTDKQVIAAIERVRNGQHSRAELVKIKSNAEGYLAKGNADAQFLIDEVNATPAAPIYREYVFMGFCPGADFDRRQDLKWMADGFCKFDFLESEHQYRRFCKILPGDVLVLKKREKFGETMRLFGHGIVKRVVDSKASEKQYLRVDWIKPEIEIEVPLMGCNSTVDVKSIDVVEKEMPTEFWDWLKTGAPTCPPQ
jgi:hypothetical protein